MSVPTKEVNKLQSKVSLKLVDPLGRGIENLKFHVKNAEEKIVAKGVTDFDGRIPPFLCTLGALLTLHVQRFGTEEMKLIKTLFPWAEDFRFKIVSGKVKDEVKPRQHSGEPGPYKRKTYKVKDGDTLSAIALAHHTSAAELAALNGINVTDIIRVDQVLKVPSDVSAPPSGALPAPAGSPATPDGDSGKAKGKDDGPDGAGTDPEVPATNSTPPTDPVPTSRQDERGGNGTPKTSIKPVCDQSGCIKLGDKGQLVEELNIRLMGFGNTIQAPKPLDEFTAATEKAVKQFQRDYMGVAETGKVCRSVLAALDEFREKYPLYLEEFACQCHKNSPKTDLCTGFGLARTGSAAVNHFKNGKNVAGVERPGIHRALFWSVRALVYYLADKDRQLGYRFWHVESGYRCWQRAKQMNTFTHNHVGNAADLQFRYASNGHKVSGGDLRNIRDKVLIPKLRARPTWDMDNRISIEPVEKTGTWIHMDVREFDSAYLLDRYYAKTRDAIEGEPLLQMAKNEGRFSLINCGGIPALPPTPKAAPAPSTIPQSAPVKPASSTPAPLPLPADSKQALNADCGKRPVTGPPSIERKPAETLSVSELGLDFIRIWESGDLTKQHLVPYNDNKNFCTIGVGHLIDGKQSCEVLEREGSKAYQKYKSGITPEQENQIFAKDVQRIVDTVLESIRVPLHQHEFDALISLAFNTGGLTKFKKLLAKLNTGNYSGCCDEFADITNHGDKALVKRRKSEMKIFRNNVYDARH